MFSSIPANVFFDAAAELYASGAAISCTAAVPPFAAVDPPPRLPRELIFLTPKLVLYVASPVLRRYPVLISQSLSSFLLKLLCTLLFRVLRCSFMVRS